MDAAVCNNLLQSQAKPRLISAAGCGYWTEPRLAGLLSGGRG